MDMGLLEDVDGTMTGQMVVKYGPEQALDGDEKAVGLFEAVIGASDLVGGALKVLGQGLCERDVAPLEDVDGTKQEDQEDEPLGEPAAVVTAALAGDVVLKGGELLACSRMMTHCGPNSRATDWLKAVVARFNPSGGGEDHDVFDERGHAGGRRRLVILQRQFVQTAVADKTIKLEAELRGRSKPPTLSSAARAARASAEIGPALSCSWPDLRRVPLRPRDPRLVPLRTGAWCRRPRLGPQARRGPARGPRAADSRTSGGPRHRPAGWTVSWASFEAAPTHPPPPPPSPPPPG